MSDYPGPPGSAQNTVQSGSETRTARARRARRSHSPHPDQRPRKPAVFPGRRFPVRAYRTIVAAGARVAVRLRGVAPAAFRHVPWRAQPRDPRHALVRGLADSRVHDLRDTGCGVEVLTCSPPAFTFRRCSRARSCAHARTRPDSHRCHPHARTSMSPRSHAAAASTHRTPRRQARARTGR